VSTPDVVEQAFSEGRAQGARDLAEKLRKRFEWMRDDTTRVSQRYSAMADIYVLELKEIERCAREAIAAAEGRAS